MSRIGSCFRQTLEVPFTFIPKERKMPDNDFTSKWHKSNRRDVIREYTDSKGRKLLVVAEFKIFNDRSDIASITIQAKDFHSPITRRMLSEIPLDMLFRDDLAIESEHLNRVIRNRKGTTAHQGRQHSDEDLLAVAEIYSAAFLARRPVQRAVADGLGVSLSTAGKRIMAARRRGFISQSTAKE
jgi:hypothetical protein